MSTRLGEIGIARLANTTSCHASKCINYALHGKCKESVFRMEQPWNSPDDIPSSVAGHFVNTPFPVRILSKSGELLWSNNSAKKNKLFSSKLLRDNLHIARKERSSSENPALLELNALNDFDNKVYELSEVVDVYFEDASSRAFEADSIIRTIKIISKNGVHICSLQGILSENNIQNDLLMKGLHDAKSERPILNRSDLIQLLNKIILNESTHCYSFSIMNMDHFHLIYQNCGEIAAGRLLAGIAESIFDLDVPDIIVGYLGGDEFGLILKVENEGALLDHLRQLLNDIQNVNIKHLGISYRTTASIGSVYLDHVVSASSALWASDKACITAKKMGRNRVEIWQKDNLNLLKRARGMKLSAQFRDSLDNGEVVLYKQLITPIKPRNAPPFYEVLVRLRTETGLELPSEYISAAEEFGTIERIDYWILNAGISYISKKFDEDNPVTLSVNVSARSLQSDEFVKGVADLLEKSSPRCRESLIIEITETAAVERIESLKEVILHLREYGVRFAIDDFGSGLTTFGYLKGLPVDIIKIDGEIVKAAANDPFYASLVDSFVNIANISGFQTVAEFVEDEEISSFISRSGVDFAQGFFIHKPEEL